MIWIRDKILEELYGSMSNGHMIGIHFLANRKSEFVVSKVNKIQSDRDNPENKMVHLQFPDINGKAILNNPISLKDINLVIPYKMLFGSRLDAKNVSAST